jgi:glycosyltransferase involved in cell wall biosynthesis
MITLDAVGGVWRYALDLASALHQEGIRCLLVGSGPAPEERHWAECRRAHAELVWTGEPLDWLAKDESELEPVAGCLAQIAADRQIDLVHLNLPSQAVGFPAGLPLVVASHSCVGTWWEAVRGDELPQAWQWQRRRNQAGLERADLVLTPSQSHADALARIHGPIPNLKVVHNATSLPNTVEAKADMVLSAGRWWDEGKNGRVLDQAAARSPWPVVMPGALTGPNGQSMAFEHAAAPGEVPAATMRTMMRRTAIFAAPSLYEPFGLAVLEAAASGAALILSDIPTFRELWSDAALFVSPHDPDGWSDAIRSLATDATARWSLAERARNRARLYSSQRQVSGILDAYRLAMQRHAFVDMAAR